MASEARKPVGPKQRRTSYDLRLEIFTAGYLKNGGVATTAAKAAGIRDGPGLRVTACRLLKEAERRGLLEARVRQILGKWEIDIGSVIDEMKEVVAGTRPSKRIVHRDRAGRVTGSEEFYDTIGALRTLATMAGAFTDATKVDPGLRLSALLARAITEHEELRKQEIAEGRLPLGLRMVKARAEAMDRPIKELRAAFGAETTQDSSTVPPPYSRGPCPAYGSPMTSGLNSV